MLGTIAGIVLGLAVALLAGMFLLAPAALLHRAASQLELALGDALVGRAASSAAPARLPPQVVPKPALPDAPPYPAELVAHIGRNAYTGSCAMCHGAKGDGKGTYGQATFPPSTDLTSQPAEDKTDTQLFAIIKNGLGFTAMPGYGDQYADSDISALVGYVRALQKGQAEPILAVPTPTSDVLNFADLKGQPAQRGAVVYFTQGCQLCHGSFGEAPEDLQIQDVSATDDVVRHGRPGMPSYSDARLSNADLADLIAYLNTGPPGAQRREE